VAGVISAAEARAQFSAIARVRWQIFANSLRTLRGRLELVSRGFLILGFAAAGFGGAFGLGAASWAFVREGRVELLAVLLWPVFLFWQLFPVMATAITENFDSSNLLRFPLSYREFFLVRLLYGSLDPATALGSLWLVGITAGVAFTDSGLFLWTAVVLLAFAAFNILLGRAIFAWVERWLARRRTRELLGILFFLFIICFQFVGPLMGRYGRTAHPGAAHFFELILPLERLLPPGLAATAIAGSAKGEIPMALGAFLLLSVYQIAAGSLLNLRLRAQYRGESLSESAAPVTARSGKLLIQPGWNLPALPAAVAAIFEKEFRTLSRSGPMLFALVMPVVVLLIFRLTPGTSRGSNGFLLAAPDLAFPVGAAYALLMLTNLIYNNLGHESTGVQMYFVSPVRFRDIFLAKNLTHACVMALEMVVVWFAVALMFRPPSPEVTLATLSGILFAMLVNFTIGNLLSLHSPKKIDFGSFGRQRASNITAFASLGIQLVVFGLAALTLLAARAWGRIWLAALIFVALAAVASIFYIIVLSRTDSLALARRESLIAELAKT
jgi:ABC-2 type transport system permease protein